MNPAPSTSQIESFYSDYDRSHARGTEQLGAKVAAQVRAARAGENRFIQELESMGSLAGKRCLDIGFGRGALLCAMKAAGGVVTGIDLDVRAVEYARSHLGIDSVSVASVMELDCDGEFDIITMIDFIEHPLSPLTILKKVSQLLTKGGLMVLWTPNASFAALSDSDPILFRVDLEHMQYLSFSTCLEIARILGQQIVHLESCGFADLTGMDGEAPRYRLLKSVARRLPGIGVIRAIRKSRAATRSEREGTYHLFCISRKSSALV